MWRNITKKLGMDSKSDWEPDRIIVRKAGSYQMGNQKL
jgi:hypothetical protein